MAAALGCNTFYSQFWMQLNSTFEILNGVAGLSSTPIALDVISKTKGI